jgi:hypothetical protein
MLFLTIFSKCHAFVASIIYQALLLQFLFLGQISTTISSPYQQLDVIAL